MLLNLYYQLLIWFFDVLDIADGPEAALSDVLLEFESALEDNGPVRQYLVLV